MVSRKAQSGRLKPSVDSEPLKAYGWNFQNKTLAICGSNLAKLSPSRGMRLFGYVALAIACVPLSLCVYFYRPNADVLQFLVLGGFAAVFAMAGFLLLLVPGSIVFDKSARTVTWRQFGLRRVYSLDSIQAIQLMHGGWHTVKGSDRAPVSYCTYQVNLVLRDEAQERMNLTNHSNWDGSWQTAEQLAEFLSVPLIDTVSDGEKG